MTKFEQDKIGREEIVNRICLLVDNLQKDQHFCLALDGDWGSGKSFVLDMVEEKLKQHREYVIIKYDAWANSFYSDPLIAILSCLIDGIQEKLKEIKGYNKAIKEIAKEKGVNLLEELSQKTGKLGTVASIIKSIIGIIPKFQNEHSFEENNNIVDFKSYQQLLGEIKENLNTLTAYREYRGKQTKLIILVDEIDRCLPDEQLKILERLHHLFDVKNCAVICALNKTSISKTFAKTYDGDGKQYLRKFFDYVVHLGVRGDIYLSHLLKKDLCERIEKVLPAERIKEKTYYKLGMEVLPSQVVEVACHYILQVVEKNNLQNIVSNREISRYYDNLIAVISEFGWEKLERQYLFFIIFGLFVNKFINHQFFVVNKKSNPIEELKIRPNTVSQTYSTEIIYEDQFINNFKNTVLNMRKRERWQDHSYGEVAQGEEFYKLGLLIIRYGGQDEYNER